MEVIDGAMSIIAAVCMYNTHVVVTSQFQIHKLSLHRLFSCIGVDVVTGTLPAVSILPIGSSTFFPKK